MTTLAYDWINFVPRLPVLLGDLPIRNPIGVFLGYGGNPTLTCLIKEFDGFDAVVGQVPKSAVSPPVILIRSLSVDLRWQEKGSTQACG
ncbi:MAG: hypothetical protein EBX97_06840 [Actinobacteria bacterium]|nr:hypothetical protein [Actinomycetota bacterium]